MVRGYYNLDHKRSQIRTREKSEKLDINEVLLYAGKLAGTIHSPFPLGADTSLPRAYTYIIPTEMEIRQSSLYYEDSSDQVAKPVIHVVPAPPVYQIRMS